MPDEQKPQNGAVEIERHLLAAGQLQYNIEVMKAALQDLNHKINVLQNASAAQAKAEAPEAPPAEEPATAQAQ